MKRIIPFTLSFLIVLISINVRAQAPTAAPAAAGACATPTHVLKMATLAPEGTSLYKGLAEMKQNVKAKTNGCVDIQIFGGGQMGDEVDVVKKIRIGQLDGGALTGRGLSDVVPEVRILELPFLFKNEAQIDAVYSQLKKEFQDKFLAKNFILLGWAEAGLVQLFSSKAIASKKDMEGSKIWVWTGDEFAQTFFDVMKVVPVPLAIADVLTSLQTGLIQVCYGPPLAAIAFQWHTKAKYMTQIDMVNATGGLMLSKAAFDKLNAEQKAAVQQVATEQAAKLVAQSRTDNKSSLAVLQASGVQVITPTAEALAELKAMGQEIQTKLVGKFFPQDLLDRVNAILATVH